MMTGPKDIEPKEIEMKPGKVAAVGTFDGVHTGHRKVLENLTEIASGRRLEPVAITFDRHPLELVDPKRVPRELTPLWKKKKLLAEAGVRPIVLKFDEELRNMSAAEWMRHIHDTFGVEVMVIGYDNTFGSDGLNLSIEDYRKIGNETGIEVVTAEEVKGVSSSAIRKAVKEGEMEKAAALLGRPFSITGKVVEGNKLGNSLGFPTANLDIEEKTALPKPGAYEAVVKDLSSGVKHKAMVNIGCRPTVMRGDRLVIEAHLLDWSGNLYGKEITVRFLRRLRDEKKFDSIEDLKRQLQKDKEAVKNSDKY